MQKYILEITAFVCGAVVMILELIGSRVIAPYLGTSTFVWTSIIGVILASLSVGYWWGGKIADRGATSRTLARAILIGGVCIGFITLLQPLLGFIATFTGSIRVGAITASLIYFAPATIALGMVSPIIVKLRVHDMATNGSMVGRLYALSTIGSIVGTFLGGFYLISFLGTINILLILSIVTILNSFLLTVLETTKLPRLHLFFLLLFLTAIVTEFNGGMVFASDLTLITDKDTDYSRLLIFDSSERLSGRETRFITNSISLTQSGMYKDNPNELLLEYTKRYNLAEHFNPHFEKVLLIGAGAYSYPKYFQKKYPTKTMDVVEIDPGFTELAKTYFNFNENEQVNVIHEDGRIFLNNAKDTYDVIMLDAFPSFYAIPFQLTTRETIEHLYRLLPNDGVVFANIISAFKGEQSEFLQAEYATYKELFPQVYLFQISPRSSEMHQNIMLVALKSTTTPSFTSSNKLLNGYLSQLWLEPVGTNFPVLTDNFAPVEKYIEKLY